MSLARSNQSWFSAYTDIPSQKGRSIFITGGTSGLGKATLYALARHGPKHLYFTGRDMGAALILEREIKELDPAISVTFFPCDFTSLASVEAAARDFLDSEPQAVCPRLDVLICNAGIMGKDAGLTKDGFELHFGVNHMAHALLIRMLMPALRRTWAKHGDVRIVNVTSVISRLTFPGGIVLNKLQTEQNSALMGRWRRYGQSKLANLKYTQQLAQRSPYIKCVSVHPGCIKTGLWDTKLSLPNKVFATLGPTRQWVTVDEGIKNILWAATADDKTVQNGAYYEKPRVMGKLNQNMKDDGLGDDLWEYTQAKLAHWGRKLSHGG